MAFYGLKEATKDIDVVVGNDLNFAHSYQPFAPQATNVPKALSESRTRS